MKKEKDTLEPAQEELKKPRGESEVKEEELTEDLLKANKREELDDERSQEEFPSYMKRRMKEKRDELDDERSQEEFPSYMKRRIKENVTNWMMNGARKSSQVLWKEEWKKNVMN